VFDAVDMLPSGDCWAQRDGHAAFWLTHHCARSARGTVLGSSWALASAVKKATAANVERIFDVVLNYNDGKKFRSTVQGGMLLALDVASALQPYHCFGRAWVRAWNV
jgi:hypothetical protein